MWVMASQWLLHPDRNLVLATPADTAPACLSVSVAQVLVLATLAPESAWAAPAPESVGVALAPRSPLAARTSKWPMEPLLG